MRLFGAVKGCFGRCFVGKAFLGLKRFPLVGHFRTNIHSFIHFKLILKPKPCWLLVDSEHWKSCVCDKCIVFNFDYEYWPKKRRKDVCKSISRTETFNKFREQDNTKEKKLPRILIQFNQETWNSSRCTNCTAANTTSPLCVKSSHLSNTSNVINLQTFPKRNSLSSCFKALRKITCRIQRCGILLISFNSSRKISIMQYEVLTSTTIKYDFRVSEM